MNGWAETPPSLRDVRLVAATNKHLETLVENGKFREDLFYRLNVVRLHMPPLRERREDIPLMVQAFLKQSCQENEKPLRELTADAMNRLIEYPWPGNVRQLRSAIDNGVVLATGPKITLRDLPLEVRQWDGSDQGFAAGGTQRGGVGGVALTGGATSNHLNIHSSEDQLIRRALDETDGNITEAARKLGISRRTLHRKLKNRPASDLGSSIIYSALWLPLPPMCRALSTRSSRATSRATCGASSSRS